MCLLISREVSMYLLISREVSMYLLISREVSMYLLISRGVSIIKGGLLVSKGLSLAIMAYRFQYYGTRVQKIERLNY